ncbi:MAG: chorismate-binding protein [Bacteroidales bacterium]|nr:chorismate-binding protein [Bacteroidales bacterium]
MLSQQQQELAQLINLHINRHIGFAIYRLPNTTAPTVVIQNDGPIFNTKSLTNIDGHDGFLFAPYNLKYDNPAVLVEPQFTASGTEEIISLLKSLPLSPRQLPYPGLPIHNMTRAEYQLTFDSFRSYLQSGSVDKLVLARSTSSPTRPSIGHLFASACVNYPRMFIYAFYSPLTGVWFGCSPETLVEGHDGQWTTMAVAGTQLYSDSPSWDEKNRAEQHIVEQYISDRLTSMGATTQKSEPYTVRAAHLMHLRTDFKFSLPSNIGIGTIASILHPTPAICGLPCEVASSIIDNEEATLRLYYSGPVGPVSTTQQSHIFVNLRCMMTDDNRLTIYAGGGIMKSSNAESEWNETEIKMDTLLNILNPTD